jgi:ubiquitin carboxyl-terminal hydrolase L3
MSLEWGPVESNPQVLTGIARAMGAPKNWEFGDVYSMDAENLCWVAQPVLACVFLYPTKDHKRATDSKVASGPCFYMNQVPALGNACGTIATMHALANLFPQHGISGSGPLFDFLSAQSEATPEQRGHAMSTDAKIHAIHQVNFQEGQSRPPDEGERVDYHFICYVVRGNELLELDGMNPLGPVCVESYVPTDDAGARFAAMVSHIKSKWIDPYPDESRFSLMALSAPQ